MARQLLVELGTEEIPARFMPDILAQLQAKTDRLLNDHRLSHGEIKVWGTPRRLALAVDAVAEKQAEQRQEIKGPALKASYDQEGRPTRALTGFASGQGVDPSTLIQKELPGGTYLFAVKEQPGLPSLEVLPELLPELVRSLTFAKSMRWGSQEFKFVRPLRWIITLLDNQVVPWQIAGVSSGRQTRGHRFLSTGQITIDNADAESYRERLAAAYVVVDQEQRREMVRRQVADLARDLGGQSRPDPELLEEVTDLIEYPTALAGKFKDEYLKLPPEVLITPMREHQRYFPVYSPDGGLLPFFITVKNGTAAHLDLVRQGNERVLEARLADAKFFWDEDLKETLDSKVLRLKSVVFQENLGNMYDKVQRLKQLGVEFLKEIKITADPAVVDRAAHLLKADLVTNMVYEFPELQGLMGAYYSREQGEAAEVSEAIREHYLPRFAGDQLPQSGAGTLLAVADKIDSLVGYFALGIQPSGSQDPYALRRQALGVLYILIDGRRPASLENLCRAAYRTYRDVDFKLSETETVANLLKFFRLRLESLLQERGYRYDLVAAVTEAAAVNPLDATLRIEALKDFQATPTFEQLLTAFNRVSNLAKNQPGLEFEEGLLSEPAEQRLWQEFRRVQSLARPLLETRDYRGVLEQISTLRPAVDTFFEEIMVMVEDHQVRNNRLALLQLISGYVTSVADLTKLVP